MAHFFGEKAHFSPAFASGPAIDRILAHYSGSASLTDFLGKISGLLSIPFHKRVRVVRGQKENSENLGLLVLFSSSLNLISDPGN